MSTDHFPSLPVSISESSSESPSSLSVSCATDRGVYEGYWKALSCYELAHQDLAAKAKRLRAWREQAPEDASFVARIDPSVISEMFSDERGISSIAEAEIAKALTRVEALNSSLLMLHTPSQLRPSSLHEQAVIKLRERLPTELPLVWRADGLWAESETFYELCSDQGITPVIDPLMWDEDEALPSGLFAYWKIMGGQGLSVRLGEYDLDKLADLADQWLGAHGENDGSHLWVNFTSPKMVPVARRWRELF